MPPIPERLTHRKHFSKGIIVEDHLTHLPREQALASAAAIIGVDAAFRRISATGDVTLAAPVIAAGDADGQFQYILNTGSAVITLTDESELAGSRLKLKTTTVALEQNDLLCLLWSSLLGQWIEVSRSSPAAAGSGATSVTEQEVPDTNTAIAPISGRVELTSLSNLIVGAVPSIESGASSGLQTKLINTGTKLVTFQDESELSGSNLKLRTPTVTLAPGCSVDVSWDGSQWVETGRSTFANTSQALHVEDFGAIGDNVTDDTAAIQAAFDVAVETGRPVQLGNKLYRITGEILMTGGNPVEVIGGNPYTCGLAYDGAVGGARAMLACVSALVRIRGVGFYAARAAKVGVFLDGASQSSLDNVRVYQALVDGVQINNSDSVKFSEVLLELCGKLYHTSAYAGEAPNNIKTLVAGTVSQTAGINHVVTRDSGSLDFTTLGIRAGDLISTHASGAGSSTAEWHTIASAPGWEDDTAYTSGDLCANGDKVYRCITSGTSELLGSGPAGTGSDITDGTAHWAYVYTGDAAITATTIQCVQYPASNGAASGLDFTIHVGDGYHEGPSRADNNNHEINKIFSRNNSGFGMRIHGLYGPSVTNFQCDANSFPVGVGTAGVTTIGATFRKGYFEINNALDNFFLGYAADIIIDQINGVGVPFVASPSTVWGHMRGLQNALDPGRVDPLGGNEVDYVPSGVITANAYARGAIKGQNYAQNGAGNGSIAIRDNQAEGVKIISGVESGGGYVSNAVAHSLDTYETLSNVPAATPWDSAHAYVVGDVVSNDSGKLYRCTTAGTSAGSGGPTGTGSSISDNTVVWRYLGVVGASVDLLTKYLWRVRNNGTTKAGFGVQGDPRLASTDTSGTPGTTATINTPSGRFAMNDGTSVVTVTCALCTSASKVFLTKQQNDATATDFKVVPALGQFVVTANASATADIFFDFFIVN